MQKCKENLEDKHVKDKKYCTAIIQVNKEALDIVYVI